MTTWSDLYYARGWTADRAREEVALMGIMCSVASEWPDGSLAETIHMNQYGCIGLAGLLDSRGVPVPESVLRARVDTQNPYGSALVKMALGDYPRGVNMRHQENTMQPKQETRQVSTGSPIAQHFVIDEKSSMAIRNPAPDASPPAVPSDYKTSAPSK